MSSKMSQKKNNTIIKKHFRLFSFHTVEEKAENINEGSGSSDEEMYKKSYKDELNFVIQMFGINEKGETCSIFIQDFQPFFYVSVGDNWTEYNAKCLLTEIRKKIPKNFSDSVIDAQLVDCHKLYGFSAGNKYKFAKLVFKNTIVMRKVRNLWIDYVDDVNNPGKNKPKMKPFIFQGTSLELYESNIPPLLRYFHINNISPSGWIEIPVNRVQKPKNKTTTCKYEYICKANDIKPLPEKETMVPYKICSFDIEANSSHGDFPVPVKTYKRLTMNIVDTFNKQIEFLDIKKAKLMLQKIILAAFGYDNFDDIDVVYPKTMPSMEQTKALIKILINQSMKTAKYKNKKQDTSYLLKKDEDYEDMKERM